MLAKLAKRLTDGFKVAVGSRCETAGRLNMSKAYCTQQLPAGSVTLALLACK